MEIPRVFGKPAGKSASGNEPAGRDDALVDSSIRFPYLDRMDETRFLGIDLGRRRVGLALSDPGGLIATPVGTLTVTGVDDALKQVLAAAAKYQPSGIVLGMPKSLSGGTSEIAEEVHKFARKLEAATGLPIYFEDERLSSQQAESVLHAHGKKIKGNKERIDRIAAAIILQSFLDRRRSHTGRETRE